MADVFISYSRHNKDFAQNIFEKLEATMRDAWIDWEGIPLSSDWWREIQDGIEAADSFVFIMSPESLASPVCALEVAHAVACRKRIVPVVHTQPQVEVALG